MRLVREQLESSENDMDFTQISSLASNANANMGERFFSSITPDGSEGTERYSFPQQGPEGISSVNVAKHFRPSRDIDASGRTGLFKIARTDYFTSGQKMQENVFSGGSTVFVRADSIVSDGCLGCSRTNSTASDAGQPGNDFLIAGAKPSRSVGDISSQPFTKVEPPRTLGMPYQEHSENISGPPVVLMRDGLRMLSGQAGPFTAEQLMELHQQTLIYKHISVGVSPPSNLLMALRSSNSPLGNRLGTGPCNGTSLTFNLGGHSSSTDPEPGRCRRTDGKKWRCAKETMPDQKYCERHMNRGRNRSRKPADSPASGLSQVSGVSSTLNSSVSPSTTASTGSEKHRGSNANAHLVTTSNSPATISGADVFFQQLTTPSVASRNYSIFNSRSGGIASCNQLNFPSFSSGVEGVGNRDLRFLTNSTRRDVGPLPEQLLMAEAASSKRFLYDTHLPIMHSVNNRLQIVNSQMKPSGSVIPQCSFPQMKVLSMLDAAVSSDGNFVNRIPFPGAGTVSVTGSRESEGQPLRRFFDDWPRSRHSSNLSWPDIEEEKINKNLSNTHLSMSLPTPMDFTSSNEVSPRTKMPVSTLKLSMNRGCEGNLGGEATQVGLSMGVGTHEDRHYRPSNWGRAAWENPMGGPLAEALHSGTPRIAKNPSLNLLGDGWDGSPENSPGAASPTGVLQKVAFGSYSDSSSSASSPKPVKIEAVHL